MPIFDDGVGVALSRGNGETYKLSLSLIVNVSFVRLHSYVVVVSINIGLFRSLDCSLNEFLSSPTYVVDFTAAGLVQIEVRSLAFQLHLPKQVLAKSVPSLEAKDLGSHLLHSRFLRA